jgi:hypothetical protein
MVVGIVGIAKPEFKKVRGVASGRPWRRYAKAGVRRMLHPRNTIASSHRFQKTSQLGAGSDESASLRGD